jgi:phage portal protein BeeE
MDYVDQVLTTQLCYQFDESYYIKHDTLANKDVLTDLQYYANGIQNGWLTQNEVRELENYEELPIESMNVPLVKNPVNVTVN